MIKLSTLYTESQNEQDFKVGENVLYLGKKGVITAVNNPVAGGTSYNVRYQEENGSHTKANYIPASTLKKAVSEDDTSHDSSQDQWLQDELLPFLMQLPQAKTIKNPKQLFDIFVEKLRSHPIGSDLEDQGRADIAKQAIEKLGLVKSTKELPFESVMKEDQLPADSIEDYAQLSAAWVSSNNADKLGINTAERRKLSDKLANWERNPKLKHELEKSFAQRWPIAAFVVSLLDEPSLESIQEQKSTMKLAQYLKESEAKGKKPEKGPVVMTSSSGYEKMKDSSYNYDGEQPESVTRDKNLLGAKVKSAIEAIIKKHASNVKWDKDSLTWSCKIEGFHLLPRTRLTGMDWYEKPQKLIDLENEARELYNGYLGRITWDEEGDCWIPLKNAIITESYDPKSALAGIIQDLWKEPDVNKAKQMFTSLVGNSKINDNSKKVMLNAVDQIRNKRELDKYAANALLKFEKMGMGQLASPVSKPAVYAEGDDCQICDMDETNNFNVTDDDQDELIEFVANLANELETVIIKWANSKIPSMAKFDRESIVDIMINFIEDEHAELNLSELLKDTWLNNGSHSDARGEAAFNKSHPELNP